MKRKGLPLTLMHIYIGYGIETQASQDNEKADSQYGHPITGIWHKAGSKNIEPSIAKSRYRMEKAIESPFCQIEPH